MFLRERSRRRAPAGSPAGLHVTLARCVPPSDDGQAGALPRSYRSVRAQDISERSGGVHDLARETRPAYRLEPGPAAVSGPEDTVAPHPSGAPHSTRAPHPTEERHPTEEPHQPGTENPTRTQLAQVRTTLHDVAGQLREVVDGVPGEGASGLSAGDLDPCLRELKRVEGAVAAIKARVIAVAGRTQAHSDSGMASPDHYLRDRLGISSREARKQRDLARTLEEMEGARDALADGRLGTEQASSIGRAARNGLLGGFKDVEDQLLDRATSSSPEQLNEAIRREEQRANTDALRRGENRAHARRRASCTKQEDGSWLLHALLDPVAGEQVAVALRAFTTPDPADTPIDRRRRPEQRAADGLAALAEAALAAGAPKQGGHRPQVSVIVPFDAWQHRDELLSRTGLAELGSGTTLSPEAAQRLLCDARITRVVMGPRSQVLDVGRATQNWTAGQRAAAAARDGGCRGPGCDRPIAWCDLHHVRWWSNDGHTSLDNALSLCHQHHRLVHEGGWDLRFDPATTRATFIAPNGREHVTLPRGSPG